MGEDFSRARSLSTWRFMGTPPELDTFRLQNLDAAAQRAAKLGRHRASCPSRAKWNSFAGWTLVGEPSGLPNVELSSPSRFGFS